MRILVAPDQLGPDFITHEICPHDLRAGSAQRLAFGHQRRNEHRARMSGERDIVIVQRVRGSTVDERGIGSGGAGCAEQH